MSRSRTSSDGHQHFASARVSLLTRSHAIGAGRSNGMVMPAHVLSLMTGFGSFEIMAWLSLLHRRLLMRASRWSLLSLSLLVVLSWRATAAADEQRIALVV